MYPQSSLATHWSIPRPNKSKQVKAIWQIHSHYSEHFHNMHGELQVCTASCRWFLRMRPYVVLSCTLSEQSFMLRTTAVHNWLSWSLNRPSSASATKLQSAIFNMHKIHYESIQHEVLQTQHLPGLHTGDISYLCLICLWRVGLGLHVQEFESLLTSSDPQDLGPFHNWVMSLFTINNWEGRMPPDSSEQWVFRLLWESMWPSRWEFGPTACMMGWSVPKASDSASAGMASSTDLHDLVKTVQPLRYQHQHPLFDTGLGFHEKHIIQACKQTACPLADLRALRNASAVLTSPLDLDKKRNHYHQPVVQKKEFVS